MTSVPDKIATWQMIQPATRDKKTGETIPGRFELVEMPMLELTSGEVLVEIAGCGVCDTDLSFFYDSIPTAGNLPLTLGHEISGTVVAGETSWLGKEVVIAGNGTIIQGGFSSHIAVPGGNLCEITNRGSIPLEHMAAVADTVATAFQAARKASISIGDHVIVIGAGGRGPFIVQMAKVFGAATVMVVDVIETRLHRLLTCGADVVINAAGKTPTEMAAEVRHLQETKGLAAFGWKIFETTGTKSGQQTALALLGKAGRLIHVVSGTATAEYNSKHLIELDAEIIDTLGCPLEDFPLVLEIVTSGKIILNPFVQTRPMSWIREAFAEVRRTPLDRHTILTTDDMGLEDYPEPKSCR